MTGELASGLLGPCRLRDMLLRIDIIPDLLYSTHKYHTLVLCK